LQFLLINAFQEKFLLKKSVTMGNHASKASEARFHEIFSQFSEEEKAALLQEFGEFASDDLDLHKEQKSGISRTGVTALSFKVN